MQKNVLFLQKEKFLRELNTSSAYPLQVQFFKWKILIYLIFIMTLPQDIFFLIRNMFRVPSCTHPQPSGFLTEEPEG